MAIVAGEVNEITTDGGTPPKTSVGIDGEPEPRMFEHPRDMTDEQLAEFKRAQDHGLVVGVAYDEDSGKIEFVKVFKKGTPIPGDGEDQESELVSVGTGGNEQDTY